MFYVIHCRPNESFCCDEFDNLEDAKYFISEDEDSWESYTLIEGKEIESRKPE